ncbi:MAG: RNA 2',3'-cyclic phosphodiesterase [Bradymonadaceae bacterium]|nr:RNA 2',3'-cyclic phosphodiesterase [Lujinxingiaceae bacterium]
MKRLFLAVDLSIAVVEKLAILQEDIQRHLGARGDEGVSVRWVDAPNIHLTLKFLGETEEDLLPMIAETIARLGKPLFPFEVECRGFGCFPAPNKPRILWAGIDARGGEVLGLLQQAIERDLDELGFATEFREFKAHVTLGRVKSTQTIDLSELVERYANMKFGKSYIKDLILYESKLDHRGPHYHVLDRFALGTV